VAKSAFKVVDYSYSVLSGYNYLLKDYLFSIELLLHFCQKSFGHIYVAPIEFLF
jgi:hypothetical protein